MKKTLLITILVSCFKVITAQIPLQHFTKSYFPDPPFSGANAFFNVKPAKDMGVIIAGVHSSSDSHPFTYIQPSGISQKPWVIKTDSNYDRLWSASINLPDSVTGYFSSVVESADGGYVGAGQISNTKVGQFDPGNLLIAKFSSSGAFLWKREYGGTNTENGYEIITTTDGGFAVIGTTTSTNGNVIGNTSGGRCMWVLRLNGNGDIIWSSCFLNVEYGYSITQTDNNDFIIAGQTLLAHLIRINSSGQVLWQRSYTGINVNQVKVAPDQSIYAAGFRNGSNSMGNPDSDCILAKFNPVNGDTVWTRRFGGSNYDFGYSVQILYDNSILVCGTVTSTDGDVNDPAVLENPWLVKFNSAGNVIWKKTVSFGVSQTVGYSYSGYAINENEFVVAGVLGTNFSGYSAAFLTKLGNSNEIKGSLFLDNNSNTLKDAGEPGFNNALVKMQKNSSVTLGYPYNGLYQAPVDTGSYTTTVQLFNPYYNVVPASKNTSFTTYFNVDSFGFAIQPIPNKQDLQVSLIPVNPARPGFKSNYVLNYKNVGTTTITNGTVKFVKDPRTAFSSSIPSANSVLNDTAYYNYTNLNPLDSVSIAIELLVSPPPTVNINDTLKLIALILPVAGDLTPADDTSSLRQRVQGSFDPNDKQESFAGRIPLRSVQDGSYINYIIRFQNTGNDTAFFVRLLDTLDNKLDWNSFQMIGSSHAYNLTIKDGNQLNWFFNNIKLPDSTTNLARSIGYVAFRIKPKNNLTTGEVIQNKASIYFDYNLPIITNTASTIVTVETTTAVSEVQNNEMKLVLGPNPVNGYSLLQINGKLTGKFELRIIDNHGRILSRQTVTKNSLAETVQVPLNVQQFSSGVYYLQLQQKQKSWWQKVVVQ